ncbi:alpha/beta hydrolase [Acidiphilium sp. CAG:727]|nr:alpha/beta hydrolase [Acidiphilium sp. CAG:727]
MRIIIITAVSVVAFLLLGFVISYVAVNRLMFVKFFKRRADEDVLSVSLEDGYYDNCRSEMKAAAGEIEKLSGERITTTSKDGITLSARLFSCGSDKLIMFFHGVRSYPPYCFGVFALEAYKRGYDLLFVDQRAQWESGGKYITYGKGESDDVLRWIEKISDDKIKEIHLYGISMGASTLCYASDKITDKRVKSIVADCGYTSPRELIDHILKRQKVPEFLVAAAFHAGEKIAKAGMKDKTEEHLSKTSIPIFFIHGEDDTVVPASHSERNFNACRSKKRLEIVKNAGHACAAVVGGKELRDKIFLFLGDNNE